MCILSCPTSSIAICKTCTYSVDNFWLTCIYASILHLSLLSGVWGSFPQACWACGPGKCETASTSSYIDIWCALAHVCTRTCVHAYRVYFACTSVSGIWFNSFCVVDF
jgi:hypothetical protein